MNCQRGCAVSLAEWRVILSQVAIAIEILFIPWYLIVLSIFIRAMRDPDSGHIDRVTFWLFMIFLANFAQTGRQLAVFWRDVLPLDLIVWRLVWDAFRIVASSMFVWHLRIKYVWQDWRNAMRARYKK